MLFLLTVLTTVHWGVNYIFDIKEHQPPLGFCDDKNRVLTHDEIILIALEKKYKYNEIRTDDSTKTAQDFYKKYPFCCSVDRPAMAHVRRNLLTGKVYIKAPDYVVAELYFPTSDEIMSKPITLCDGSYKYKTRDENLTYTSDGTCIIRPLDKSLNFTKSRVPVSNCGGIGSATHEDLNIKDTPFGNDELKERRLMYIENSRKLERNQHGS